MMLRTTTSRAAAMVVRQGRSSEFAAVQRRLFSSRASNSSTVTRQISSTSKAKTSVAAILSNPTTSTGAALSRVAAANKTSVLPLEIVTNPLTKAALPWIGNLSYIAIASGFLMTDMLDLRILLVGGYTGLVAFHSLHERPLRIPLKWSAVFVCVNAAAVGLLLMDRYTTMEPQEEALYESQFGRYMTRGQFQQLLQLATRERIPAGTRLTSENVPCNNMFFLLQGQAQVFHGPNVATNIATIEEGGFVNDVAFQRTTTEVVGAYGTVVTTQDCEVLVWDIAALKQYLGAKPSMEQCMNYCMSDHLVKSLMRQRDARHENRLP